MKRYFLRIIHNLCIHGHFAYLFAIVLKNASFSASFPREKGERKREKIVKRGGEWLDYIIYTSVYTAFSSLMKPHKLGKKWSENASKRVHFSKFSYPWASLRWTQHSKSRPPLLKSSDRPCLGGRSKPFFTLKLIKLRR